MLSTHFKEQEDFQTALRAAGETETAQQNIQDWLQLDEWDPAYQFLTGRSCCSDFLFIYFHQHCLYYYIFNLFSKFFGLSPLSFASLIWMYSFQSVWISEGLLQYGVPV